MAFNSDGLQVMGDNATIGTGDGSIRRVWFYVTNDTLAQVETDAYFDAASEKMQTGDIIVVSFDNDGTEGHKSFTVTKTTGDIAIAAGHGVAALGTLASVGTLALSTSDTYTDSAVNTAINAILAVADARIASLQAKLDALIAGV